MNAVVSQEQSQLDTLKSMFEKSKSSMAAVCPKHMTVDRLIKIALFSASKNPTLLKCNKLSIWQCVAKSAQLGLEPDGALGEAYMVPYRNNKTDQYEAQFIIGYRGLISLARRSGEIESIEAHVVYERDRFKCVLGLAPILEHEPCWEGDPGKAVAVYAIAKLKGGGSQWEVMTKGQIEDVRKRSRAGQSGPWVSDWGEMAKKTVVRRLAKYLPLSVQLASAIEHDNAVECNTGEITTLDVEASEVALIEETQAESPQEPARPQSKADLLTSKI